MDVLGYSQNFLLSLSPFGIAGILTTLSSVGFGFFVYLQNTQNDLYKKWFLFTLFVALWGCGAFFISVADTAFLSYLFWTLSFGLGVVWIPPFFLNVVLTFCGLEKKRLMIVIYISGIVFSYFALFTPYFFEGVRPIFGSFYYGVPDFRIFFFFLLWWFGLTIYTHYLLLKTYPTATEPKKLQIKYFFVAVAAAFGTGSLAYLPFFHIDIYPWGTFGIALYPIIMSYAILEHQLLDINLAVKKALVSSVIVALIAWGLLVLGLASNWLSGQFNIPPVFTAFFGALIAFAIGFAFWQRTKNLDKLKYEFMTVATHKLRTPLTEIRWATNELEEVKTLEDAKKINRIITSGSNQLLELIQTLIQSIHSEDTSYMYQLGPCSIDELTRKVLEEHQDAIARRNLNITFTSIANNSRVWGDRQKLTEAIQIFLENAITYSSENGSIVVDINMHDKNSLILRIRDNGIGIEKSDQEHLFERLHRGKNVQTTYPEGAGLGLFMAKQILERHKGIVGATSEGLSKGSTFWFILPVLKTA